MQGSWLGMDDAPPRLDVDVKNPDVLYRVREMGWTPFRTQALPESDWTYFEAQDQWGNITSGIVDSAGEVIKPKSQAQIQQAEEDDGSIGRLILL